MVLNLAEKPFLAAFYMLVGPILLAIALLFLNVSFMTAFYVSILPLLSLTLVVTYWIIQNQFFDQSPVNKELQDELLIFKDEELKLRWKGERMVPIIN